MGRSAERGGSAINYRSEYWRLTRDERYTHWAKVVAPGLSLSVTDAVYRIARNNTLPIEDFLQGTVSYPRFIANANLLAESSPLRNGPRGLRPSLASAANILRISDITRGEVGTYGIKFAGLTRGIGNFLLEQRMSAANPQEAPGGVAFSDDDIRHGIYIPKRIDVATARALGVIYANGSFGNGRNLMLFSPDKNKALYEVVVRRTLEEAFNFSPDQNIREAEMKTKMKPDGYGFLNVNYASKALKTYLLKYLGFPGSREARRKKGLSREIKSLPTELQDEFLKYFLAASVFFDWQSALVRIADVSQPILKDITQMIRVRVTKDSISLREGSLSDHSILSLSTIPSLELYLLGFLNVNPRIKAQAEKFWTTRVRSRAYGYLKRTYPHLVEKNA